MEQCKNFMSQCSVKFSLFSYTKYYRKTLDIKTWYHHEDDQHPMRVNFIYPIRI